MKRRATLFLLVFCLAMLSPMIGYGGKKVFRAGVASMITPVSTVKYYQQVVDYIGQKLGVPIEMVHRTTYDEIDIMLENRELDLAFICSSPYVLNNEKFGAELLVAPQVKGSVYYFSNIIVHRNSEVKTFDELKGKTFAFMDPKSNSGKLYPTYLLSKNNYTPETFFDSYFYSYSHNKSVELVAKKRTDGAAVDSIVYDFMVATGSPYTEQTRVIHHSPKFGIPPVVVPPGLPLYIRESLKTIFLQMHNDAEGQKILGQMRIDKFVEVADANYDSIRAMRAFIANNAGTTIHTTPLKRSGTEKNTLLFGVLPRDNPILIYERYQPLMDYLSEKTGLNFELYLEKTYTEVVNTLGRGRTAFALLGPLTYLDAHKRFGAIAVVRSKTATGEADYTGVIVTSKNNPIGELEQLQKKRFAFAALWSTSGNLMPRYMLAWSGIHLEDLESYKHFSYHDTVAKKVISGEFAAGALRESTALRYQQYGLKIVSVSEPIPTGPLAASVGTDPDVLRKVEIALLEMEKTERGRTVLQKLDPDLQGGFIPASDTDYFAIRNMINDVPQSCGIKCHPRVSF